MISTYLHRQILSCLFNNVCLLLFCFFYFLFVQREGKIAATDCLSDLILGGRACQNALMFFFFLFPSRSKMRSGLGGWKWRHELWIQSGLSLLHYLLPLLLFCGQFKYISSFCLKKREKKSDYSLKLPFFACRLSISLWQLLWTTLTTSLGIGQS